MYKKIVFGGLVCLTIFTLLLVILPLRSGVDRMSGDKTALRLRTDNFSLFFNIELPDAISMERTNDYWGYNTKESAVSRDYLFYTEEYPKPEKGISLGGKVGNRPFAVLTIDEFTKRTNLQEIEENAFYGEYQYYAPGTLSKTQLYPVITDSHEWTVLTPEGAGFLTIIDPERDDLNEKNRQYLIDILCSLRIESMEEEDEYRLPFTYPESWGNRLPERDMSYLSPYDLVYFDIPLGRVIINPELMSWLIREPELERIIVEEGRSRYGNDPGKISDTVWLDAANCFDLLDNGYFPDSRIRKERIGNKLIFSLDLLFDENGKPCGVADEQTQTGRFLLYRMVATSRNIFHIQAILTSRPGDEEAFVQTKKELTELINSIPDTIKRENIYATAMGIHPTPKDKEYTVEEYPRLSLPLETQHYEWIKVMDEGEPYSLQYDPEEELLMLIRHYRSDSLDLFTWYDENGTVIKEAREQFYAFPPCESFPVRLTFFEPGGQWTHPENSGSLMTYPWNHVINYNTNPLRAVRRQALIIPDLDLQEDSLSYSLQWEADQFYEIPHEQDTFKFSVRTVVKDPPAWDERLFEKVIPFPPGYKGEKNSMFIEMKPDNKDEKWGALYMIRRKQE